MYGEREKDSEEKERERERKRERGTEKREGGRRDGGES